MLPKETSLFEFIVKEQERKKSIPLKESIKPLETDLYFNFGLKTSTWNLLVNK